MVGWDAFKNKYKIFIISLVAYLLISNLSYFPHYISYFNELLLDRKMGYTILADSNLDWAQNKIYLEEYLEANPDARYLIDIKGEVKLMKYNQGIDSVKYRDLWYELLSEVDPQEYKGGPIIIPANILLGITADPKHFQWLRENKKPVDHLGYSYLIFNLQPDELQKLLTYSNE
jgi:hypothetical protein